MNIHISKDGTRTIKLTTSEIKTLTRAHRYLSELARIDPTITKLLDDFGSAGLREVLELPCCQLPARKETQRGDPVTT